MEYVTLDVFSDDKLAIGLKRRKSGDDNKDNFAFQVLFSKKNPKR